MSRVEYRYAENQIDRLPALVASGTVIVRGWAHEVSSSPWASYLNLFPSHSEHGK